MWFNISIELKPGVQRAWFCVELLQTKLPDNNMLRTIINETTNSIILLS